MLDNPKVVLEAVASAMQRGHKPIEKESQTHHYLSGMAVYVRS